MGPIFIAAGEVSGDRFGARLIEALKNLDSQVPLIGWGGPMMEAAGLEIMADLTPHSAVGILEQLPGLPHALRAIKQAKRFFREQRPSVVVLVDYQGANMQLAQAARKLGIPTVYYITPQVWIWGTKRSLTKVTKGVDTLLAIFEKEAQLYQEAGGNVQFVGHPLLDQMPSGQERGAIGRSLGLDLKEPILGLLPGSRRNEVETLLPAMLGAVKHMRAEIPTLQVVLPVASPFLRPLIEQKVQGHGIHLTEASGMGLIQACDVVVAASGTAALEAAVVGTPAIAAYRVSGLTAIAARFLMRSPYVTLPNLLLERGIIPELLQRSANPERIAQETLSLLQNPRRRQQMAQELGLVRAQLGRPGSAARAAQIIMEARRL